MWHWRSRLDVTSVQGFNLLHCFEISSTVKINIDKTHGLYCTRFPATIQLPSIVWTNEHIRLLGVFTGKQSGVSHERNEVLSNFKAITKRLSSYQTTFNANSLLCKTKTLIFDLMYKQHIPLHYRLRREINKTIEKLFSNAHPVQASTQG